MSFVNHSRFRKVAPALVEQRCEQRQLVWLQHADLYVGQASRARAVLIDISSLGCKLEYERDLPAGSEVQIGFFERDPVPAKIIWYKDGQMGCRFDEAIDTNLLRALTLRSI